MKIASALYGSPAVKEPGFARWLFLDGRAAWLWFALRMYVGYQWLEAGRHKIWPEQGSTWLESGDSLKGFWQGAVAIPEAGRPAITYDWYRDFLQYMLDNQWYTWFAKVIAVGEFAVGIALICGAFVGVAAFFGTFMNFNFMLAGTASTNPVLFGLAVLLILAWRTGGLIGADRWLLPTLKTPWQRVRMPQLRPQMHTG